MITKSPSPRPNSRQTKRRGVALVVAIWAIALLTILLVVFFSRALLNRQIAFSSTQMVRSEQMSRTVFDVLVGQLREEIRAGAGDSATDIHGVRIYPYDTGKPIADRAIIPSKSGVSDPSDLAVLKVSGAPMFTTGKFDALNLNSIVATDKPSRNGRFISAERWFDPRAGAPGLGINGPDYKGATPPNWNFITRDNGIVGSPSPSDAADKKSDDYVVGRFAYVVYDTSGLLDANVAGFSSSMSIDEVARKGNQSYADVNAANVSGDRLVQWRNPEFTNDDFATWATGLDLGGNPRVKHATKGGYRSVAKGSNAFINRRDLVNAALSAEAGFKNSEVDALEFFTHFSRSVTAPTFTYPVNPGSNLPSENPDAESGEKAGNNRDFTKFRFSRDYLAPDGARFEPGDLLVTRRFPLERIDLVKFDALAGAQSEIHRYFGLLRSDDNKPWVYTSPDSNAPAAHIKTLEEVEQERREPDFFELLKAFIHKDSLGVAIETGTNVHVPYQNIIDSQGDLQILRIGANIIDQWDEDDYPTIIEYRPNLPIVGRLEVQAYGVEDIPYLTGITWYWQSPDWPNDASSVNNRQVDVYCAPELKMPHRARLRTTQNTPSAVRVFFVGYNRLQAINEDVRNARGVVDNTFSYDGSTDNTGYIQISNNSFSEYYPVASMVRTATVTGSMSRVDHVTIPHPIYGVKFANTLDLRPLARNPIILQAIYPTTWQTWNGYAMEEGTRPRHTEPLFNLLTGGNPLVPGNGFNVGVMYLNHNGQPIVYNALTGIIDGQGKFNTPHDVFGLGTAGSSTGLWSWWHGRTNFPINTGPTNNYQYTTAQEYMQPGTVLEAAAWARKARVRQGQGNYEVLKADPRGTRISAAYRFWTENMGLALRYAPSDSWNQFGLGPISQGPLPGTTNMRSFESQPGWPGYNSGGNNRFLYMPGALSENRVVTAGQAGTPRHWYHTFYYDNFGNDTNYQDGRVRPGDAARIGLYYQGANDTVLSANSMYSNGDSFPIILNRRFRSTADLGYVFRDMPYKTLDMYSQESVDAALLDVFCISEEEAEARVVAGKINPNRAPFEVLEAILDKAGKVEDTNLGGEDYFTRGRNEPGQYAQLLIDSREDNVFSNVADMVTKVASDHTNPSLITGYDSGYLPAIKTHREGYARALGGVIATRTWNVLIDLVLQTGRYANNTGNLEDFQVEGERRYWLSVAIDRFTGEVVDQQLELAQ